MPQYPFEYERRSNYNSFNKRETMIKLDDLGDNTVNAFKLLEERISKIEEFLQDATRKPNKSARAKRPVDDSDTGSNER